MLLPHPLMVYVPRQENSNTLLELNLTLYKPPETVVRPGSGDTLHWNCILDMLSSLQMRRDPFYLF